MLRIKMSGLYAITDDVAILTLLVYPEFARQINSPISTITDLPKLSRGDWISGKDQWIVDQIVHFGGQQKTAKELSEVVLKGQKIKNLQHARDYLGMTVEKS